MKNEVCTEPELSLPAMVIDYENDKDDFLLDMNDDPIEVEHENGFILPIIDDLEPFSLDSYTVLEKEQKRMGTPVTPPHFDRPTVDVDSFLDFAEKKRPKRVRSTPSEDLNEHFRSPHRGSSQAMIAPEDCPSSRKTPRRYRNHRANALRYYRALTKLATSMRQSEETRLEVIHQRQMLPDVYGHLEKDHAILSGLETKTGFDYKESRARLMSYICSAMDRPPPFGDCS